MGKLIINIILVIMLIGIVISFIYLRVTNIDMTGLRLFITYWKQYVLMIVILLCGVALYCKINE